jgi:Ribosome inactivating protein
MPPPVAQATIDLNAGKYQTSLGTFRNLIETAKSPTVIAKLVTPANVDLYVQVRVSDIYVVAFYGANKWYTFNGEEDGQGDSCGVGSNYAQLGKVGDVTRQDLIDLGSLAQFAKGVAIDKRLLAILFAVVSEATRFATVSAYFTGMTNGVPGAYGAGFSFNFEELKERYFNNWTDAPDINKLEVGKLYHYTSADILVQRNR